MTRITNQSFVLDPKNRSSCSLRVRKSVHSLSLQFWGNAVFLSWSSGTLVFLRPQSWKSLPWWTKEFHNEIRHTRGVYGKHHELLKQRLRQSNVAFSLSLGKTSLERIYKDSRKPCFIKKHSPANKTPLHHPVSRTSNFPSSRFL